MHLLAAQRWLAGCTWHGGVGWLWCEFLAGVDRFCFINVRAEVVDIGRVLWFLICLLFCWRNVNQAGLELLHIQAEGPVEGFHPFSGVGRLTFKLV